MRNSLMWATLLPGAAWKSPFVIYRSMCCRRSQERLLAASWAPSFSGQARVYAANSSLWRAKTLAGMHAAERDIESRLKELTTEFRRPRQSSIASELLGIISAFEALKGKERTECL